VSPPRHPLSVGRCEFAGTWTCCYHGWTFDLQTGVLKAALTDGPDSPICGKVRVKTYPVEERCGLVWVYMGDVERDDTGTFRPPPVEADIPEQFFEPDVMLIGRMSMQQGNWRYACENAFDEGHVWYLHRYGSVHSLTWKLPAWSRIKVILEDETWVTRDVQELGFGGQYGALGRWPRNRFWNWRRLAARVSMRLPCTMRLTYGGSNRTKYAWYVPVGRDRNRYLQLYAFKVPRLSERVWAYIYYWAYARWADLGQFNRQDAWMVGLMPETAPERLYRPDVSITGWRKLCEHARGLEASAVPFSEGLEHLEGQPAVAAQPARAPAGQPASPAGGS